MASNLSNEEKEVCKRIKQFREQIDMKQYQFAKELGISPGTLSDIESCKTTPRLRTVISLYGIFSSLGYNIEYLLTGKSTDMVVDNKEDGIEYLTDDEREALTYFRLLPQREQLMELGELRIKVRLAGEKANTETKAETEKKVSFKEEEAKLSNSPKNVDDEILATIEANAS